MHQACRQASQLSLRLCKNLCAKTPLGHNVASMRLTTLILLYTSTKILLLWSCPFLNLMTLLAGTHKKLV